jgi:hypothetical protein
MPRTALRYATALGSRWVTWLAATTSAASRSGRRQSSSATGPTRMPRRPVGAGRVADREYLGAAESLERPPERVADSAADQRAGEMVLGRLSHRLPLGRIVSPVGPALKGGHHGADRKPGGRVDPSVHATDQRFIQGMASGGLKF